MGLDEFYIGEVKAYDSYFRKKAILSFWRSTSGFEVDLIIDQKIAIEIKATSTTKDKHLKGLRMLLEENILEHGIMVSQDQEKRLTDDGITIYPWQLFLENLWSGKIF